ncbi:unnamed protein product [Phytophthora fragariaefolia]|uniref:Unnamed protein product n=1 Tax=Phytophthora fragariaefolia TaxID=1490495 RepID=A0A9W7DC34_9STRA|nr:unnamed protein product [Phytophthora fragariaefolia]
MGLRRCWSPAHDGRRCAIRHCCGEYVTRYSVAGTVKQHTAEDVAPYLMENVVLKFGTCRELLTDGAQELTGKAIQQLAVLLQTNQINPVHYRPQMVGLVERFHRTGKDCVATYMSDKRQRNWDVWIKFAVYSYYSGQHATVLLSPIELMMERKLRSPNDLLRSVNVTEVGPLTDYHRRSVASLKKSPACAEVARRREKQRRERYYNRKARARRTFFHTWRQAVALQTTEGSKGSQAGARVAWSSKAGGARGPSRQVASASTATFVRLDALARAPFHVVRSPTRARWLFHPWWVFTGLLQLKAQDFQGIIITPHTGIEKRV